MNRYFLLILLLPTYLNAQSVDTVKLKANLALTGIWQAGNVQTFIFRAKSEVTYRPWKKWVFTTRNSYVYQEFGRSKADEDILSLNFLYFNPDRKVYPLLLGIASTNFRREIDLRYLLGAGFTYQLIKQKGNWLKISLSTEFEQTDFDNDNFNIAEYDGDKTITTVRGTIWANGKYHFLDKKLILTHEGFFQPSLRRSNNYRWQADIGLEFPLWKYLNLKVNYLNTFENIVISGQEKQDHFLTFGFNLKSY